MVQPKIIGTTFGAFDLCHAGHISMFREVKQQCDYLIVGLHSNPQIDRPEKNQPIMSLEERRIILEGIKYIDEIFIYDTEAELYTWLKLNQHRLDVRFIGADWQGKKFTGDDLPIRVIYNSRDHGYSTTELRRRIAKTENEN